MAVLGFWLALATANFVPGSLGAEGHQLRVESSLVPAEISPEIRALLQTKSVRINEGEKPLMEFWLRNEVPVSAVPPAISKALDALQQPVLLGAARLPANSRDYRDDEIPAGVYTVRFGLQPADGNHLGSSDFTYFAVLIPAKLDAKPDGIADYKALMKASSQDTSTGHPRILSLRPVSTAVAADKLPSLEEPAAEHKSVRVRLPAKAGQTAAEVIFDLVYAGKAPK
jgi:hypothetical protein